MNDMNKRISLLVVFSLLLCSSWSQTAVQPPGGGREEDPYFVSTLEHLYYIALHPEGGYFVQTADIDATATRNWFGGKGFLPIGNSSQAFRGAYEGNGHVIKGLYINRPELDKVGLFGELLWGQLNGIGLINANITGKNNVGGICGSINYTNPISGCFVTGSITGNFGVGGLFGAVNDTEVSYCYSNCNVKSNFSNAGGLIGSNAYSHISCCYSIGNVIGSSSVGGLIGFNFSGSMSNLALVSGCYASASVKCTGASEPGALIGDNTDYSIVSNSYWNAEIAGTNAGYGSNAGVFASCLGLTTNQMKQSSSFTGWNFSSVWKIRTAQTYPALSYVADNAPFAFREVISQHAPVFEILPLLSNDYDYETLQASLILKITGLSAGSHDNVNINFPASAHMGDTLTVTYKVGQVRVSHNDTIWGNTVSSLLVYSNQAPVITEVPSNTITEDSQLLISPDEISAFDPDGDPYTFFVFNGEHYTVNGLTISPALNYNGILQVGMGATDGAFISDTAYMEITINAVNDVPEIHEALSITISEDSSLLISLSDVVYTDPDDGDIIALIVGQGSNYSIEGARITSSADFNGNLNVPLNITDGTDTSVTVMMHITVIPINDAPVIVSEATLIATEETEYTYAVIASDVDDTELTYSLTWRPANMTISSDGIITWIPAKGFTTSGTVTVVVSDGEFEDIQSFIITVNSSNDVPAVRDTAVVTSENVPINVEMPATDPDGTISAIAVYSDPLYGTTRRTGLAITYTPDVNFTGKDSLTWYAVDNNGAISAIAKMVITVNDVNYPPVISSAASVYATGGVLYTYAVIATDVDGDELTYSLSNQPSGMTIDDNGIISWLPGNVLTSGEITLSVSDGALEDTEIFTIAVSQLTSTGTMESTKVTLYPNPCRDYFTIDAGEQATSLRIFDLNGNLVLSQPLQGNCPVDVSHLMNGSYIVNLNGLNIKLIKSE
jgi:hypothetical protein